MPQFLKVEHALRNAVKNKRDFDHSAEWIAGIVGKLSISPQQQNEFLDDLVEFFNTYPKGKDSK